MKRARWWIITFFLAVSCVFRACESGALLSGSLPVSSRQGQSRQANGELEVHFLDVGQGDSTLIETGNHAMLIDAGNNNRGTEVQSYLSSQGIDHLDYVIGTHPDADHIGGLDVVIYKFDCDRVIMPDIASDTRTYEDVERALKEKDLKVTQPAVGDTYTLGDARFTIVAPNRDYGSETNDWSVGILLTHGEKSFLFTGDAGENAEEDIIDNGIDIQADVYMAAHHGSKTGSADEFLDAVSPEYAVISCGEGNDYGHPSAQTLNSFRSRGIAVFRTDMQGTVVASSDGEKITWNMSPDDSWKAGEPTGSAKTSVEETAKKKTTVSADKKSSGAAGGKQIGAKKTTYILNTNTMKYHKTDCSHAKSIRKENREKTTLSKKKLQSAGYEPCASCKP